MVDKIAFIGATGMLGVPVAKQLAKAGLTVTALARNPARARQILPATIKITGGDIRDRDSLVELLGNNDALYINLNLKRNERKNDFHAETDGLKNIVEIAKTCGIRRIAFISSVVMNYQGMNNFNWWVFDMKRQAVEMIRRSGIAYTIFYPSTFMENFLTTYRMGNKVLLAGQSNQKMYFISAVDYGRQVAASFKKPGLENREYVIQGLEAFTADEAAALFVKHYQKEKLKISRAPLGILKFVGKFSPSIDYGAHIVEALNNYPEKFEADLAWKELGKPIITLRDFAIGNFEE